MVESCGQFLWRHHRRRLPICPRAQPLFPEFEPSWRHAVVQGFNRSWKEAFPWLKAPRMQWVDMKWVSFTSVCLSRSFWLAAALLIYYSWDAMPEIRYTLSVLVRLIHHDITATFVLLGMCWAFPHPCRHILQHSNRESELIVVWFAPQLDVFSLSRKAFVELTFLWAG